MKKRFYELVFRVTETCDNGKERTFKKSVFAPPFFISNGKRLNNALTHCIPLATKALEEQHYYRIEFLNCKSVSLTFTDDIEENF